MSKYIIGDSRLLAQRFRRLKLPSPDLIVTSPPYHNLKNYNEAGQIGRHQPYKTFLEDVCSVMRQCHEISKENASLWLVVDTTRKSGEVRPLPFDLLSHYNESNKDARWELRDVIIWKKDKNVPWHDRGRLKKQFEYVLFCTKNLKFRYDINSLRQLQDYKQWWLSYPERYNPHGQPPTDVWSFQIPIRGWGNGAQPHLCPLPFPLIERMISLSSKRNDVVLDPFAGSGSVVALAEVMGRVGIGFDISSEYKDVFKGTVRASASKYWAQRRSEIDALKTNLARFEVLNTRLRAIKCAQNLVESLHCIKGIDCRVILVERKSKLALMILAESRKKASSNTLVSEAKRLMEQLRVSMNVTIVSSESALEQFTTKETRYLYTKPIVHRYSSISSLSQFILSDPTQASVLSNIRLSLSKGKSLAENLISK